MISLAKHLMRLGGFARERYHCLSSSSAFDRNAPSATLLKKQRPWAADVVGPWRPDQR